MQHDVLFLAGVIIIIIVSTLDRRRSFKPYPNPQPSKLKVDLLTKQSILSPHTFWVVTLSNRSKNLSFPWPFRTAFSLYDEGVVAQVPGKTIQLSYEDIDYFWAKGINDVALLTKLEDPTAIVVKINKYHAVLQLLTEKGVKQKNKKTPQNRGV